MCKVTSFALAGLLSTLLNLAVMPDVASAKAHRKDWSKLNLDKLEEEWKTGDDEEELSTPGEELYQLTEKMREETSAKLERMMNDPNADLTGPVFERAVMDAQASGKPAMIFTKLDVDKAHYTDGNKSSDGLDWDALASICDEWK
eukprot:10094908-Ditylum_brightwellii.AAC.1